MSISRSKKRNSTGIPNSLLNDNSLSFRARGLASFILSKPDDWRIDSVALARAGKDGRTAIRSALTELECAGYLRRHRAQGDRGLWYSYSTLYETKEDALEAEGPIPVDDEDRQVAPESGFRSSDNRSSDAPTSDKPASGEPTSRDLTSTSLAGEERIETLAPTPVDAGEIPSLRDAIVAECGLDTTAITRSAEGALAKAVREIADVGGRPEDVRRVAAAFRSRFTVATLTPLALSKHWCQSTPAAARPVPALSEAERFGISLGRSEADHLEAEDAIDGQFDDSADRATAMDAWQRTRRQGVPA